MRNLINQWQPWSLSRLLLQMSWLSVPHWSSPKAVHGSRNSHSNAAAVLSILPWPNSYSSIFVLCKILLPFLAETKSVSCLSRLPQFWHQCSHFSQITVLSWAEAMWASHQMLRTASCRCPPLVTHQRTLKAAGNRPSAVKSWPDVSWRYSLPWTSIIYLLISGLHLEKGNYILL